MVRIFPNRINFKYISYFLQSSKAKYNPISSLTDAPTEHCIHILELSVLFHDTDIRMYDRPCYWPSQGLGPESGARPTPNLFPMEYNSSPGELDTWCWCLNKVKVILKIVQFGFRNLWSSSGWHDWSTKHRSRFVTMLIYLRSYSAFCWEFNCSHTAPSQTRFCQLTNPSAPRHFQGLKG